MKSPKFVFYLLFFVSLNGFSQELLKDIATSNGSTEFKNEEFNTSLISGDTLFFLANPNGVNQGFKIWYTVNGNIDAQELFPNSNYSASKFFRFKNNFYAIFDSGFYSYLTKINNNYFENIATIVTNHRPIERVFQATNNFYLLATDTNNGRTVWSSDGSPIGTSLIYTTTNNFIYSSTKGVVLNDIFYFTAYMSNIESQLWRSDGTVAGTYIVKNDFGSTNYEAEEIKVFNNSIYIVFSTNNSPVTSGIWKSDGTTAGTNLVYSGGKIKNMLLMGSNIVFVNHFTGNDRLIRLNISNNSTSESRFGFSYYHFVFNNILYFIKSTVNGQFDLYKVDAQFDTSVYLYTLSTNVAFSSFEVFIGPGKFYLQIENLIGSQYPYYKTYDYVVSNGNGAETQKLSALNGQIKMSEAKSVIGIVDNSLFLGAYANLNGYELWQTNGTVNGTNLVKDINSKIASSKPEFFTEFGDKILFFANDIEHGKELWSLNTTNEEIKLELDLTHSSEKLEDVSSTQKIDKNDFGVINNKLIYINQELKKIFSYDGINTPVVLENSLIDHTSDDNFFFTPYNGKLYYRSGRNTNNVGSELWATDGTPAGTSIISDLNVGYNGSYPRNLIVLNSKLLFTIDGPSAICKTDGTNNGTLITQIFPNNLFILPQEGIVNSSKYFFSVYNFTTSKGELWTSTENAVVKIKDVFIDNTFEKMHVINDIVYFKNSNSITTELWRSDGTTVGTYVIESLLNNSLKDLFVFNQNLYFTMTEGQNTSIYKTNGTINGKTKVKIIDDNYSNTSTKKFMINANKFIFSATQNNPQREEIWESNGTEIGTKKIYTLRKDISSTNETSISEFFLKNSTLYFAVDDGVNGKELWKMDLECKNNLVLSQSINTASNHLSGSTISAFNTIKSTGNVTYSAKNSILLQAGTKIEQGAIFTAKIEGCDN